MNLPVAVSGSTHRRVTCRVDNLSRIGCRIHSQCRFAPETYLTLTFPDRGPIGTRVAWSDGLRCGLKFCAPLHVAVLDDLLRRFRRAQDEPDTGPVALADWRDGG